MNGGGATEEMNKQQINKKQKRHQTLKMTIKNISGSFSKPALNHPTSDHLTHSWALIRDDPHTHTYTYIYLHPPTACPLSSSSPPPFPLPPPSSPLGEEKTSRRSGWKTAERTVGFYGSHSDPRPPRESAANTAL